MQNAVARIGFRRRGIAENRKICYNPILESVAKHEYEKEKNMHYTYKTSGVCSTAIDFDIENGKLHNIVYTGGCNGNLKSIGRLLEGADAEFAVERLSGVECGFKNTSCGDQLARAIKRALAE